MKKDEALSNSYVRTPEIMDAVRGHEQLVFEVLGIDWKPQYRNQHVRCPYPGHGGQNDWRWCEKKAKAICSCTPYHSIVNVVAKGPSGSK